MTLRRRHSVPLLALVLGLLGGPRSLARADVELPMLSTPTPGVRIDGWLREWNVSEFASIGNPGRARLRVALSPGEQGLYIAASVDDDHVVRTRRASLAEDAIVVQVACPGADGNLVATELTLFAGIANLTAATLTAGPVGGAASAPRGASIVEMATSSGYDLEAFVPWAAVPGARDYARARALARMHDVDATSGAATDVSSAPRATAPDSLPRVVGTAGELFPFSSFLRAKRITAADVELDLRGNFSGDATPERILVASGTLAIFGARYSNGREFDYADLGFSRGAFSDARAIDFDGDGRVELAIVTERGEGNTTVRELRVFRFPGDQIVPLFTAEIGLVSGGVTLASSYSVVPRDGAGPAIRIAGAEQTGTGTRRAHAAGNQVVPLFLASSGVLARTYAFTATTWSMVNEERPAPVAAPTTAPSTTSTSGTRPATTTTTAATTTQTSTAPARGAFSAAPLLAAARRDRSIAESVPDRFATTADLVEDARAEEIHTLGRTLVVVGPGYRGGAGYFALDLGVTDPSQVVGVSARDVTGDGKAEIWVNVRQPVGPPGTYLEIVIFYRMTSEGLAPILTAQLAVGDSDHSVRNDARVVGSGRTLQLALSPGTATGFDARTFPFTSTATPGMTTLLLPWRDHEQRYRWTGSAMVGP